MDEPNLIAVSRKITSFARSAQNIDTPKEMACQIMKQQFFLFPMVILFSEIVKILSQLLQSMKALTSLRTCRSTISTDYSVLSVHVRPSMSAQAKNIFFIFCKFDITFVWTCFCDMTC